MNFLRYLFISLALQKILGFVRLLDLLALVDFLAIFEVDLNNKMEVVLEYSVSGVEHLFELFTVLHPLLALTVRD